MIGVLGPRVHRLEAMRGTEVQDTELAFASYEDVARLEIAVNNSALVSVCQAGAQLLNQLPGLRLAHRCGTQALDYTAEQLAVEHLHREKDDIPVSVQFVDIHYIAMGKNLTAVKLEGQVRQGFLRALASVMQYLQRNILLRLGQRCAKQIESLEHRTFAAGSQLGLQDVSFAQYFADAYGRHWLGSRRARGSPCPVQIDC
jgi:hypothetical protein